MTAAARRPAEPRDDGVCGPCSIGECGHCVGNVDLKVGSYRTPLTRCSHRCPGGQIRQAKLT